MLAELDRQGLKPRTVTLMTGRGTGLYTVYSFHCLILTLNKISIIALHFYQMRTFSNACGYAKMYSPRTVADATDSLWSCLYPAPI